MTLDERIVKLNKELSKLNEKRYRLEEELKSVYEEKLMQAARSYCQEADAVLFEYDWDEDDGMNCINEDTVTATFMLDEERLYSSAEFMNEVMDTFTQLSRMCENDIPGGILEVNIRE